MEKKKVTANTKVTAGDKPRGKPFTKNDPRINRDGRPKTGQSWSEIIAEVWDQYPEELLNIIPNGPLSVGIKNYPKSVQIKYLMAVRVTQALLFEPTHGLLKETLDRLEGKVKDRVEVSGTLDVDGLQEVMAQVYGKDEESTSG
jgi:hypothetical protein